jgi:hypothetical protein
MRAIAQARAARAEAVRIADPAAPGGAAMVRRAVEEAVAENTRNSRLFVVDAGLGREALRARYPDRTGFAIVRGIVRAIVVRPDSAPRYEGSIESVIPAAINVPRQYRSTFESVRQVERSTDQDLTIPFAVSVAFGRRLEPWITAAVPKP